MKTSTQAAPKLPAGVLDCCAGDGRDIETEMCNAHEATAFADAARGGLEMALDHIKEALTVRAGSPEMAIALRRAQREVLDSICEIAVAARYAMDAKPEPMKSWRHDQRSMAKILKGGA